mmetsp:Transcript_116988/g.335638  ORF Transcript_116988/g.335638 Transcript_116988/m.335638 type:complete len:246 (-) Transcript_116988:318-1055(-)
MLARADEVFRRRPQRGEGVRAVHRDAGAHGCVRFVPALVLGSLCAVHVQHRRGDFVVQVHLVLVVRGALRADRLAPTAHRGLCPGLGRCAAGAVVVVVAVLRRLVHRAHSAVPQPRASGPDRPRLPGLLGATDRLGHVAGLAGRPEPGVHRRHVHCALAARVVPLGLPLEHLQRRHLPAASRRPERRMVRDRHRHAGCPGHRDVAAEALGCPLVRALGLHALGVQLPPDLAGRARHRLRDLHGGA